MQPEMAAQVAAPAHSQDGMVDMTEEDKDEQESSLYKEDSFRMYCMKVLPCSKRYCHDWTTCPFSHPGEKARRRDPRTQPHTGIACPDRKKEGTCIRGDNCPYAHNVFEYWLHPTRYRTQLCNDGTKCRRHICFFAHSLEELRVPSVKPFVPPDALAAATTAAGADLARKTATANVAGAANTLDAGTLRALAEAVLNGAASSQQDGQAAELARSILSQPNAVTNALVNQLAQLQVQQNQQLQQQQQDQLKNMSLLSAYLQNAQAPGQHQSQPPHMPQLPEQHSVDSWQQAQSIGISDRQQLAFRSLSEAAVDRRSSDMVRAHLEAQSLTSASASSPRDALPYGNAALHGPAVTAGAMLAQQSLLYAPTQLGQQLGPQGMSNPSLQPMFSQFSPHGMARNAFASHSNSLDLPRSSFSDMRRRSNISQQDWMSVGTGYSGERFSGDRFSHDSDMLTPGSKLAPGSRRNSFGNAIMGNSFDLDWAGRPVGRTDPNSLGGLPPSRQDPLNPLQFNQQHQDAFSREAFARDAFNHQVFRRGSQDSNASTVMHTDGRPSIDDRLSLDSMRSGFGSPQSPTYMNTPVNDFPFAYTRNFQQPQQQQQHQQHPGMLPSASNGLLGRFGSLAGPGSGPSGMPENEDAKAMY